MAIGHGGQILLSEPAAALARDGIDAGVELLDLGEHARRDLATAELVFQVSGVGLRGEFPRHPFWTGFPVARCYW